MIRKLFICIAILAVLLTAWYYRVSIKDSIVHNVNDIRKTSPYTDDRLEGDVKKAMGK
jgi:hypothetical protein